jgi:Flp pilus assembly pilin Flp
VSDDRGILRKVRRRTADQRGALSIEYLLILASVVIPLAAMTPLFYWMVRIYSGRITLNISLPFP